MLTGLKEWEATILVNVDELNHGGKCTCDISRASNQKTVYVYNCCKYDFVGMNSIRVLE